MGKENNSNEPITVSINLNTDQNTRALNKEEIIHPREFDLVIELIKNSLKKFGSSGNDETNKEDCIDHKRRDEFARYHDTITISGARGTGKTTFILSILRKIENSQCTTESADDRLLSEIEVLEVIDPTLIEEKTHLLVNIISKIHSSVTSSASFRNLFSKDDECSRLFNDWEKSFNDLAEGLPVLDGIGKDQLTGTEWDDPKYVMCEGVRKAKAASELEKNFHRFLEKSLKIIGKKAFLICFDDIDTNFAKGWPVLEVLRKYLTSARIITVLSGDFELYSTIVRKSQWKNIEIDFIQGETKDTLRKYETLVSQLENQYLLKVLRPERRVTLNSIFANYSKQLVAYYVNGKNINFFYENKLSNKYSIVSKKELKIILNFVMNLPIRTQIQLLVELNQEKTDDGKSIFNIFWNNWAEWNSSFSSIFDQPETFPLVLIKFLLSNKLLGDGFYLLPNHPHPSISASLFISGLYYHIIQQKREYLIFDFLLRIGLVHEVQELLYTEGNTDGEKVFDTFIDHCKIETQTNLRIISGRYNSISLSKVRYNKTTVLLEPIGNVELLSLYKSRKQGKQNRIDYILPTEGGAFINMLGFIPLSIVSDNRGYRAPKYSIYNLLSAIGELLKIENPQRKDIFDFIIQFEDIRTFPKVGGYNQVVANGRLTVDELEDLNKSGLNNLSGDMEMSNFVDDVLVWLMSDRPKPSPHFLANLSSRLNKNLQVIPRNAFADLGEWISFVTSAFVNCSIIEEYLSTAEKDNMGNIRLTFIRTSYRYFLDNLNVVLNFQKHFPFSLWLLKCPLIKIFIDFDALNLNGVGVDHSLDAVLSSPNKRLINLLHSIQYIKKPEPILIDIHDDENILAILDYLWQNNITYIELQAFKDNQISEHLNNVFGPAASIINGKLSDLKKILLERLKNG